MLLIPLPAWLALGILQLPLGSSQVRTCIPSLPAPWHISLSGLLSTPLTPQHPNPEKVCGTATTPVELPGLGAWSWGFSPAAVK